MNGRIIYALLVLCIIIGLSVQSIAQNTITSTYWDRSTTNKLLWLLRNILNIDTSKYTVSSIRMEAVNEKYHTELYIVELKRTDNIVLKLGVVVDENNNIIEITLKNPIPDEDIITKYKIKSLYDLIHYRNTTTINTEDLGEIIDIVLGTANKLSANSSQLKQLINEKIIMHNTPLEIKEKDQTKLEASFKISDNYDITLTLHLDNKLALITVYRNFIIAEKTIYKHPVLAIILRPVSNNKPVYVLYGIKYEPYKISIYSKDKIREPYSYVNTIKKYVENKTSCNVLEIKFWEIYGIGDKIIDDTRIIHIYYSYIAETSCNKKLVVHLAPSEEKIIKIEQYGYYPEGSNDNIKTSEHIDKYMLSLVIAIAIIAVLAATITYIRSKKSTS